MARDPRGARAFSPRAPPSRRSSSLCDGGFAHVHSGVRRPDQRRRASRLASVMLGLLCATVVPSCEVIDDIHVVDDVDGDPGRPAESAPAIVDSSVIPSSPPVFGYPDPGATGPDQGSNRVATHSELTALRAAMDVPVAGVTRTALRDSYTEARGDRSHEALDIIVPRGTPVLSATDGRLLKIFNSQTGGLMVYASDASGRFILLYGHLDRYADGLSEGMTLARGQVIGYVGTTGNAPVDTPHLHFGILRGDPRVSWWTGVAVNPYPLLVQGPLR